MNKPPQDKSSQFAALLDQEWHLPPGFRKQPEPSLPPAPADSCELSVQAAKNLPPPGPKAVIAADLAFCREDAQGNRTRLGAAAKKLAQNVEPVWETRLGGAGR